MLELENNSYQIKGNMGKTFKKNNPHRPKSGKEFKEFKTTNKFKKWNKKQNHFVPKEDNEKDVFIDEIVE